MFTRSIEQNPIGNPIRGTRLYYNCHTAYADWGSCNRCILAIGRRRVSLRFDGEHHYGIEPKPTILFIGDHPDGAENATGIPFTGRSGTIMDIMWSYLKIGFRYTITDLVCCQPKTVIMEDRGIIDSPTQVISDRILDIVDIGRKPTTKEIEHCTPHIDQLVSEIRPHGIVYLGALASIYRTNKPNIILKHPREILQLEKKVLTMKKQARKLEQFIKELSNSLH